MAEVTMKIKDGTPVEKRHYPRLATFEDVTYTILEKGPLQERKVTTKNISAGGLCLIVCEKIEVDNVLALRLNLRDINYVVEAKGRVVWSSCFTVSIDGRDRYILGIEFIEISESDRQQISQYVFVLFE